MNYSHYPYISEALTRIHGYLPKACWPVVDPTNDEVNEGWYEEIVYVDSETAEKPTAERIIEEVLLIKEEENHI